MYAVIGLVWCRVWEDDQRVVTRESPASLVLAAACVRRVLLHMLALLCVCGGGGGGGRNIATTGMAYMRLLQSAAPF